MNLVEVSGLPKPPQTGGAGAFGQMGKTLSRTNQANQAKSSTGSTSSTGGETTKTPTGSTHTATPNTSNVPKDLIEKWISFLKGSRVVAMDSDPKTGKLIYKKKATVALLSQFLKLKTDFEPEEIDKAIQTMLAKKGNQPAPQQNQEPEKQVADQPQQQPQQPTATPPKEHGGKKPGEVSQTPNAIRKRNDRAKPGDQMQLVEEFTDKPVEIDEKDVETVFSLLHPAQSPEDKKTGELDKLKTLIKTHMSPEQRLTLFTALKESVLFETSVNSNAINTIFNTAIKGGAPGGVDSAKLLNLWKKGSYGITGRNEWAASTTDLDGIAALLKYAGFKSNVIGQVLNQYGYEDDEEDDEEDDAPDPARADPAIMKIAEYAKNNGLKDELIAYLQSEFGDEVNKVEEPAQAPERGMFDRFKDFGKRMLNKVTNEEVEQIFIDILKEHKLNNLSKMKIRDKQYLGRERK